MTARREMVYGAAALAAAVTAFWVRYQFVQLYGGHAADYQQWADSNYFGGISRFYVDAARRLAAGESFPTTAYPPGYSAILSIPARAGHPGLAAMRLWQIGLDSAGALAVYGLLRVSLASAGAAIAGAWAYALHPLLAAGGVFLLGEGLTPLFVVLILLAVVFAARGVAFRWLLAGIVVGAAVLVRPDLLVMAAGLAAFAAAIGSDRWRQAIWFVLGVALLLGPWGLRNRIREGAWVFTSASAGAALYEGLGDVPNAFGYVADDSATNHLLMAHGITTGAGSVRGNQFLQREYLRAAAAHPGYVAGAIAARWRWILFSSERLQPLYFPRLREVIDVLGPLLVIAALLIARRDPLQCLIIAAPVCTALFGIGLTHFEPRYVRYAQLSNLFAAVLLLDRAAAALRDRVPRVAGIAGASAGAILIAVYCLKQLVQLHHDGNAFF